MNNEDNLFNIHIIELFEADSNSIIVKQILIDFDEKEKQYSQTRQPETGFYIFFVE